VIPSLLTWIVYRLTALLSPARRPRALLGDLRLIQDLIPEVDAARFRPRSADALSSKPRTWAARP